MFSPTSIAMLMEIRMADKVYLLWFVTEGDESADNGLLIGVYPTETDARAAIDRLRDKPGFVDFPQGFQIHSRNLGQDSWTQGFVHAK
jgi:hypothetical protein